MKNKIKILLLSLVILFTFNINTKAVITTPRPMDLLHITNPELDTSYKDYIKKPRISYRVLKNPSDYFYRSGKEFYRYDEVRELILNGEDSFYSAKKQLEPYFNITNNDNIVEAIKKYNSTNINPELYTKNSYDEYIKSYENLEEFSRVRFARNEDIEKVINETKLNFENLEKLESINIVYEFRSSDDKYTLPSVVLDLLPEAKEVAKDSEVTPENPAQTSIKTAEGVWEFKGYEKVESEDSIKFIGTWEFTPNEPDVTENEYTISYKFISNDGKELPKEVLDNLPADEIVKHGTTNAPTSPKADSVTVEDGKWEFISYDKKSIPEIIEDGEFIGTWEFKPFASYKVKYIQALEDGTTSEIKPMEIFTSDKVVGETLKLTPEELNNFTPIDTEISKTLDNDTVFEVRYNLKEEVAPKVQKTLSDQIEGAISRIKSNNPDVYFTYDEATREIGFIFKDPNAPVMDSLLSALAGSGIFAQLQSVEDLEALEFGELHVPKTEISNQGFMIENIEYILNAFSLTENDLKGITSGIDNKYADVKTFGKTEIDGEKVSFTDNYKFIFKVDKVEVNKSTLSQLVLDAEKLEKAGHISEDGKDVDPKETWVPSTVDEEFTKALNEAKSVLAKETATQEEVDNAVANLNTAIETYKPENGTKVNLAELEAAITKAEGLTKADSVSPDGKDIDPDKTWVTEEVKNNLEKTLSEAKSVLEKIDSTQEEVDNAVANLNTAIETYKPENGTKVNLAELEAAILKAEGLTKADKTSEYGKDVDPSETWVTKSVDEKLTTALNNAKNILADNEATQENIDKATNELLQAIESYKPINGSKVYLAELEAAISKAEGLTKADKTSEDGKDVDPSETWVTKSVDEKLTTALNNAKNILADNEATQENIDKATNELLQAIESYKPINGSKVYFAELEAAISKAEGITKADKTSEDGKDVDQSETWVTEEVKNNLEKALSEAKSVLEKTDIAQEEVDNAVANLNTAVETYKPEKGTKVNLAELEAAILKAEGLAKVDKTSEDGKDVDPSETWVTEEVKNNLETALSEAKSVLEKADIAQEEVDNAVANLNTAIETYKPEKGTKVNTVTISFNSNGGSEVEPKTVEQGNKITSPKRPQRDGYKFKKWALDGKTYNFDNPVNSDITLDAVWEKEVYTVKFMYGKTIFNEQKVEYGEKVKRLETDPKREGYKHIGWSINKGGTPLFDLDTPIKENITLLAVFEQEKPVEKFTVTFDSNGGTEVAPITVEKGQQVTEPTPPTRDGYEFKGWMLDNKAYDFGKEVNSNITLKAYWENAEIRAINNYRSTQVARWEKDEATHINRGTLTKRINVVQTEYEFTDENNTIINMYINESKINDSFSSHAQGSGMPYTLLYTVSDYVGSQSSPSKSPDKLVSSTITFKDGSTATFYKENNGSELGLDYIISNMMQEISIFGKKRKVPNSDVLDAMLKKFRVGYSSKLIDLKNLSPMDVELTYKLSDGSEYNVNNTLNILTRPADQYPKRNN